MFYKYLLIFCFISCTSNKSLVGKYKTERKSIIQEAWDLKINKKGYVIGSTLELKSDSSFELINCGNIRLGKWSKIDDTLQLFTYLNKFRIDSINQVDSMVQRLKVNSKVPLKYKIKGTTFKSLRYNKYKKYKIYTVFEKI